MKAALLIAETDADLREAYERLCADRGFQVQTAKDGLECLTKLASASPQALVVDLDIPWGGGEGVLACLRENCSGSAVLVVIVTGGDSPEVLSERSGIPSENCFQKPLRVNRVLQSVCETLGRDCRFSAIQDAGPRPRPEWS